MLLMLLLLAVLLAPAVALSKYDNRLAWTMKYMLAVLPLAYTWGGWKLAVWAYPLVGCLGGSKGLHGCMVQGHDITWLIGYGFFLMIPCAFVALPLTLWLVLNTGAKHIGARHNPP